MVGGPIQIESIRWNMRTMDVRAASWELPEPLTFTLSYAQVAGVMLWKDASIFEMCVSMSSGATFNMRFECENNARDAAAELARRMEAAG